MPLAANPHDNFPPPPGLASDSPDQNLYQVLGVSSTAGAAEITRAYRSAMKRVHPDRQQPDRRSAAEEQARRLNRAYAVLSKPIQRQSYDRTIRATVVQDEIMSRYVGGFYVPQHDSATAPHLRRAATASERREQAIADRSALVSLVVVFGGLVVGLLTLLLFWAALQAIIGSLF